MVSIDEGVHAIAGVPDASTADVVGIGPGLGTSPETIRSVRLLLESHKRPMVLDADALNIISAGSGLLQLIPPLSILTPHPKEFERLAGPWSNDFEKLDLLRSFARDLNVIVVLKGAFSAIASPDGSIYFNPTGNPGMATGGSGDVLTGIVTGLLAQGYSALESAMLGVYLHGASGDVALADKGMEGLIASDLIDYLPRAFKRI
jgi:NAD(P)H-hydrate epimerase